MAHSLLRRRPAERAARDPRRDRATPASRTCSRCAATRRRARRSGSRIPGGLAYSVELVALIRESLRLLHRRAPASRRSIRRPPDRDSDLRYLRAQGRRGRELPDHAALLRQRATTSTSSSGARERHRRADHPGDHADHQLRADQALHQHVRRDDPDGAHRAARGARRRPRKRSPSSASPTRRSSAPTCWRAARRASTSTRSTSRRRRARSCPRSSGAAVGAGEGAV